MSTVRRVVAVLFFAAASLFARDPNDGFRIVSPPQTVQIRVQVLYPGGTTLYDSDWRGGNILDVSDLPYGSYQLRISSRDLDGKLTEKETALQVSADRITIDPALPEDLKLTTTAHDGTTGQIITTSGDLSFRFGDYLNHRDTEAMRLSPEGNLEVKGWIRAGQGILFSDGTLVDTKAAAEKRLKPKADASGTGTQNQIAKWIDNVGTLGDSTVTELGGNVGIGTTTPSGKLHIFGGATSDVFAGMGVNMVSGPAFNFGYGGASFGRSAGFFNVRPDASATAPNPSLRFMTANTERMIITNLGNIGIGTSTPGGKLQVFAAPTADVFAGFGTDMSAGPSLNFGYGGATFGRGAGFFNARPDPLAIPPNPSLRFMTANAERMIITVDGRVGIGTSSPGQKLDVAGNLGLPFSGVFMLGNIPFAYSFGTDNAFFGLDAGNFTMSGSDNTAVGTQALSGNTSGDQNVAGGAFALQNNTTGFQNTAVGFAALAQNVSAGLNTAIGFSALFNNLVGSVNTAIGASALSSNTSGASNTATGQGALQNNSTANNNTATGVIALGSNTTGAANTAAGSLTLSGNTTGSFNSGFGQGALVSNQTGNSNTAVGEVALNNTVGSSNIGIGDHAGTNLTTGSNNIDIANLGVAAESATTRIGTDGTQTRAFIGGIRGVTTDAQDAVNVLIDSNGQLGTVSSSRRYKFDIADMKTDKLMLLRPVTFRYLAHRDNARLQYGLIAEEVAEVYPELVARNKDGQPETVMYQFLAPMLLNEVQEQQRTIEEQRNQIATLRQEKDEQIRALDERLHKLEALAQR